MSKLTLRYDGVTIREYELSGSHIRIGRHSDNGIQLDDPTVSSVHAELILRPDAYMEGQYAVTVVDRQSTNGVYVNGERVSERRLQPGDVIRLGRHELVFDEQGASFGRTAVQLLEE